MRLFVCLYVKETLDTKGSAPDFSYQGWSALHIIAGGSVHTGWSKIDVEKCNSRRVDERCLARTSRHLRLVH